MPVGEPVAWEGGGKVGPEGEDSGPPVSIIRAWRPERQATSFSGRLFLSCVSSEASPERQSLALGVGHCATRSHASPANVFPWPLPWLGAFPVVRFSLSEARGVGQEEDAGALVRGSNITRTNDGPGASVAPFLEILADAWNNPNCSGDVLPEEERGLALDGDADVLEEEAAPVAIQPGALPGETEVLARRSSSDEIHKATPRASVEGAHVVPDRSRHQ